MKDGKNEFRMNFNYAEFEGIKNATGLNRFILFVNQWEENTYSLGIIGRVQCDNVREKEIPSFIKRLGKLKTLCKEQLTQEQKELLFSKVISFERIKKDL